MGGEDSAAIVLSRLATKEAYITDSLVLTFGILSLQSCLMSNVTV